MVQQIKACKAGLLECHFLWIELDLAVHFLNDTIRVSQSVQCDRKGEEGFETP